MCAKNLGMGLLSCEFIEAAGSYPTQSEFYQRNLLIM